MGLLDIFDTLITNIEGNYSNKGREKIHRTEEEYETYLPQNDIYESIFSSSVLAHLYASLIKISAANVSLNKIDKTNTFNDNTPLCSYFDHVGGTQNISGRYYRGVIREYCCRFEEERNIGRFQ